MNSDAQGAQACVLAGLDAAACGFVDRQCAIALAVQPWSRVRGQVDRWICLADPALADERAARAEAARGVQVGKIKDGHCDLWGRLDAADGVAFDQALSSIAKTLPTELDFDARRAAAVGVLARQALGQAELPRSAEIVVRIDAALVDGSPGVEPVADVQGWGSMLTDRLGSLLEGCKVTVRPVLDARTLAPSDCYELPARMRRVLVERWGVDAFPYGSRPATSCQADHTTAFDHDADAGHGQTHPDLMSPLGSFSHRMKTHAGYECEQPEPGVLVWTTPHGWTLLTTPAGTIRIGRPPPDEHAWWLREPPDWVEDDPPPIPPPDPGPAQPPLALAAFLAS